MSYILDAIKKADQKRKLGSVPDVHTVHESPTTPSSRLMWPYLLAAGLFLNAAVITIWLQPWAAKEQVLPSVKQEQVAKNSTAETTETASKKEEKQSAQATVEEEVPANSQANETEQTAIDSTNEFDPALEGTPANLSEQDLSALPPATQETIAPPVEGQAQTDQEQEITTALPEDETLEQEPEESLPAAQNEVHQEPRIVGRIGGTPLPNKEDDKPLTEQDLVTEKRELARIPFMFQMPDSVKKDLPDIHVSFHSYSSKPSARLVSINGKILREGQSFEKDLTLEKITKEGVVILFKSRRFRIDL